MPLDQNSHYDFCVRSLVYVGTTQRTEAIAGGGGKSSFMKVRKQRCGTTMYTTVHHDTALPCTPRSMDTRKYTWTLWMAQNKLCTVNLIWEKWTVEQEFVWKMWAGIIRCWPWIVKVEWWQCNYSRSLVWRWHAPTSLFKSKGYPTE